MLLITFLSTSLYILTISLIHTSKAYTIGAFLHPYDINGKLDEKGVASIAAFKLAVAEINNSPSTPTGFSILGKFRDPFTIAQTLTDLLDLADTVTYLVSDLDSRKSVIVAKTLFDIPIMQMIIGTNSAELSQGESFPRQLRLIPSEAFDVYPIKILVSGILGYSRVTIFSTNLFRHAKQVELFSAFKKYNTEILTFHMLVPGVSDYSSDIEAAKTGGALVFILFLDVTTAAVLLEQGYKEGLFHEGTTVVGVGEIFTEKLRSCFTPNAPVDKILRGTFGVAYNPQFYLDHSLIGKSFVAKMKKLPPTAYRASNGTVICSSDVDGDGRYLYRRLNGTCDIFDFSTLTSSTIGQSAALVYDAIYLLVNALLAMTKYPKANGYRGEDVYNLVVNKSMFSFNGVSGRVAFEDGIDDTVSSLVKYNDFYGRGDRSDGTAHDILHFNSSVFNKTGAFVRVGLTTQNGSSQLCDGIYIGVGPQDQCQYRVSYNTFDGSRPSDRPPDQYVEVDNASILTFFAAVVAVIIIGFTSLIIIYRSNPIVKAAQPFMLLLIATGELIAIIFVFISALDLSPSSCIAMEILGQLSIWMILSAVTFKLWRINKIFNNTTLKKVKITEKRVVYYAISLTLIVGAYVGVLVALSNIRVGYFDVTKHNQKVRYSRCESDELSIFQLVIFIAECLLLLYCFWLAWATNELPPAFNDSIAVKTAVGAAIICIAISLLADDFPTAMRFFYGFSVALLALITTLLLLGHKVMLAVLGYTVTRKHGFGRKDNKYKTNSRVSPVDADDDVSRSILTEVRRAPTDEIRTEFCAGKILFLKELLIAIQEGTLEQSYASSK